jgi:FecR protein
MKRSFPFNIVCGVLLLLPLCLHADEFSEHLIAARAGVVNYVEGRPLVFSDSPDEGKLVTARTQVRVGDRVQTSESDRIEILLNPGSYLRLGPSSEVRVRDTDFGAMHFEVIRGEAIVESATFDKKVHALKISTPAGDIALLKDGLYRLAVIPGDRVEVSVHKGKVSWQQEGRQIGVLTSGKRYNLGAPLIAGEVQYAKLEKNQWDALDRWSRRRAEFLVAANDRLSPGLLGSVSQHYRYNLRGGWLYNPFFNCFTFVPFDDIFGSPYGLTYTRFCPVRQLYRAWDSDPGAAANRGGSRSPSGNTTYGQRGSVGSAPSAPAARVETGRSERESRSRPLGRTQNR